MPELTKEEQEILWGDLNHHIFSTLFYSFHIDEKRADDIARQVCGIIQEKVLKG